MALATRYGDATAQEAYDNGYSRAFGLAQGAEIDEPVTEDGTTQDEDGVMSILFDIEENDRQFTPFEFQASALNADEENSDTLWDAYDNGVTQGLTAGYNWTGLHGRHV